MQIAADRRILLAAAAVTIWAGCQSKQPDPAPKHEPAMRQELSAGVTVGVHGR